MGEEEEVGVGGIAAGEWVRDRGFNSISSGTKSNKTSACPPANMVSF